MGRKKSKRFYKHEESTHKKEISDDSFKELMDQPFEPVRAISVGNEVEATVIGFDSDNIYLDLGSRLDGVVKKAEYMISGELTVAEGDVITVFINGKRQGTWLCSGRLGATGEDEKKTRQTAALMALEEAFNKDKAVEGQVVTVTKGGFEVEIMGVKTFCPLSQIDINYCDNPEDHLEQFYAFKIIRFEEQGENIVVSRRELLEHEAAKKAESFWRELDESRTYEGEVTTVLNYGAFVDIGGIEGLLHVSEISYERLKSAEDALTVGEKIEVTIKSLDRQLRKVSFSRKSLLEDPWTAAVKKLSSGAEFQGKVVRMKTFGAFIELFPGVDGLVHVSRLGTGRRHQHPKEVLKIGDIVMVRVMDIDEENRKISLTMEKQEGDFSRDLAKIRKDQDKQVKSAPTHMASLFDEALNKKKS
jgi:small subunit ribosomal protein S1